MVVVRVLAAIKMNTIVRLRQLESEQKVERAIQKISVWKGTWESIRDM